MENNNIKIRKAMYAYAYSKLKCPSVENKQILRSHLFHLKVNSDYVINSKYELDALLKFINKNYDRQK